MGGLLHLVQRGGAWAGCGPAQSQTLNVYTEQSRALQSFNVIEIGTNRIESPYVIFC